MSIRPKVYGKTYDPELHIPLADLFPKVADLLLQGEEYTQTEVGRLLVAFVDAEDSLISFQEITYGSAITLVRLAEYLHLSLNSFQTLYPDSFAIMHKMLWHGSEFRTQS